MNQKFFCFPRCLSFFSIFVEASTNFISTPPNDIQIYKSKIKLYSFQLCSLTFSYFVRELAYKTFLFSVMASSSSAPDLFRSPKHQVFLSFRGEDTRNNFLYHLYEAFRRKGIGAYADFNELPRGEEISHALLQAIKESMISIIVFSQNYATSSWCLEELSEITECRKSRRQLVVPIFYHVNPSDIRKQTGSFGKAFVEHERNRIDKVQGWRHALIEASNLSGWSLTADKPEPLVIEDIVQDIVNKLTQLSKNDYKGLVGIGLHVEQIKSMLCIGEEDVRIIGIWGMGGIGKTTLAQVVYDEVSAQFESCHFLANVREETQRHGAITLRDNLLSKLLNEDNLHMGTPMIGSTFIKDRLRRKRVLVVLDDVNDFDQLEILAISHDHFGSGSRIIVTSRDKQVLINGSVDGIYKVKELSYNDSLQLFSQFAFKQNHLVDDFKDLSNSFLKYAKGIPIALKVLGSTLHRQSIAYWESALNRLKQYPNLKIQNVLKISFDALDEVEKNMFLDIACFFKGYDRDYVTKILDGCYEHSAYCGITNLIDKCLLNVTKENMLGMHDLLQEMGGNVVRAESPYPEERSRLWTQGDIRKVLENGEGTKSIQGMLLDLSQIGEIQLHPGAFARMHCLRIFKFYGKGGKLVPSDRGLESLPNELRCFHWEYCMLKSLPSKFHPEKLVELRLPDSKVEQLWNGKQDLVNLRVLDLSYCENLTRITDLSTAINIERFRFSGCKSLVELPSMIHMKSLKCDISANWLYNLKKFPELPQQIKTLDLDHTVIEEIPESIGCLKQLASLGLRCSRIHNLPSTIVQLDALEEISLSNCPNITMFPNVPEGIRKLQLDYTPIEEVPLSISRLKSLSDWSMRGCRKLKSLPTIICELKSLEMLSLKGCSNLECFPEILKTLECLYDLNLGNCRNLSVPSSFCNLVLLEGLDLSGSDIVEIPKVITQLPNLISLDLACCKNLKSLPELPPCLRFLYAGGCTSLESVLKWERFQYMIGQIKFLRTCFMFNNCFNLDRDAVNNIVANAQLRIQCIAEQFAAESLEGPYHHLDKTVIFCFPGSEIPETFKNRSTNSSITVQLSPACSNKRFLGFAVCIVVDFEHHHKYRDFTVECKYRFKTKNGGHQCTAHRGYWPGSLFQGMRIESNHVILFYKSLKSGIIEEAFRNNHSDEASFEFYVRTSYQKSAAKYFEVQKCGVNVLYVDAVRCNNEEDESSTYYRSVGEEALDPTNEALKPSCHAISSFTQDEENIYVASMLESNSAIDPNRLSMNCDVHNRDLEGSLMEEDANNEEGLDDPTTTMRARLKRSFSSDEEDEPEPQRLKEFHFF